MSNLNFDESVNEILILTDIINSKKEEELYVKKLKILFDFFNSNEDLSNKILEHPLIKKNKLKILEILSRYESQHEKEPGSFFKKKNVHEDKLNIDILQIEGELLKLNKNSKLLFLGGGAHPYSAIQYSRKFKCHCTCIDIDKEAIELSKKLIDNLPEKKLIKICHGDATTYPFDGFDVIFMSSSCFPKEIILKRIKKMKDKVVALRNPKGLYRLWYPEVPERILKEFKVDYHLDMKDNFHFEFIICKSRGEKNDF